ncbi:MAG: site-specific integrase [Planctomycetota bacterium]|nr:site-specific integrase [Planctomycetota bacterium]MDA1141451.1 site-specific integrase [Planctomycetota bacterium]
MTLGNLSPKTIEWYVHWVAKLCQFIGKTPGRMTAAEVRKFLVHLITVKGLAYSSVRQTLHSLRCYYVHIQKTPEEVGGLPPRKKEFRLPEVLGQEELFRLLHAPQKPSGLHAPRGVFRAFAERGHHDVAEFYIPPGGWVPLCHKASSCSSWTRRHPAGYNAEGVVQILRTHIHLQSPSLTSTAKTMGNRRERLLSRRNISGDS